VKTIFSGLTAGTALSSTAPLRVTIAKYVTPELLAEIAADIDWQLWVSAEGEPLPIKYVITSKWITGAPQFSVQLHDWNSTVSVNEADVTFVPPDGAREFEASAVDELGIAGTE
jgi:hypothetical protein